MAKKNGKVLAAVRDDLIVKVTSALGVDTDADRAWAIDQALAAYKRHRVRLLEYLEGLKETK